MHQIFTHTLCISESGIPTLSITEGLKSVPVRVIHSTGRIPLRFTHKGDYTVFKTLTMQGFFDEVFSGGRLCDLRARGVGTERFYSIFRITVSVRDSVCGTVS